MKTVIHMKSSERNRVLYPSPSKYAVFLDPPIYDIRAIRMKQAVIPRTDFRVAEGTMKLHVDRVIKYEAHDAFVFGSLLAYTQSESDSIWSRWFYVDVDSPLNTVLVDDAVVGSAIDAYISSSNDSAVVAFSRANAVIIKAFSPPSGISTSMTQSTQISTSASMPDSVVTRPSLRPGRAWFAYLPKDATGTVGFGIARVYIPQTIRRFDIPADMLLVRALGTSAFEDLSDYSLGWSMARIGSRLIGLIFEESVVAYTDLEGTSSSAISEMPAQEAPPPLQPDDLREILGIIQTFGPLTPAQIQNTAFVLDISLNQESIDAINDITDSLNLVVDSAMINLIAQAESDQAALELQNTLFEAAVANGYFKPVGDYGDFRVKLVDEVPYASDIGTKDRQATIISCNSNTLLLSEGGWLKIVDAGLWSSQVADVASRRLLRYYGAHPISASLFSSMLGNESSDTLAALASPASPRLWSRRSSVPNAAHWPPIAAVPTALHRGLHMLLFRQKTAWVASTGAILPVTGETDALSNASPVPGQRILCVSTGSAHILAFSEAEGALYRITVTDMQVVMSKPEWSLQGYALPAGTDAISGVIVPPFSRCFMLSNGPDAFLYAPGYLYKITGTAVFIYLTSRMPSAVALQDVDHALFSDALGITVVKLYDHNDYERLSVDRGDDLDTNTLPFISWSNPAALIRSDFDFYVFRTAEDPLNTLVNLERTSGLKPSPGQLVYTNWREADTLVVATETGIHEVELVASSELIEDTSVMLVTMDTGTGMTRMILDGHRHMADRILCAVDNALLLRAASSQIYLYDTLKPSSGILVGTDDNATFYWPTSSTSWITGTLSTVTVATDLGNTVHSRSTPVTIENAVLQTVAYAPVPQDEAPIGWASTFVAMGSTGSRSRLAVFSTQMARADDIVWDVVLPDLLAGAFVSLLLVDSQVAIAYRNTFGGISTQLVPIPYARPDMVIHRTLSNLGAAHLSMVSWTEFNHNTFSEVVLVFHSTATASIRFFSDIAYERTGQLHVGADRVLLNGVDAVDFLESVPIAINDTSTNVCAFATVFSTADEVFVALSVRDYTGWVACTDVQAVTRGFKVLSVSHDKGQTIFISGIDTISGVLGIVHVGDLDMSSARFTKVLLSPSRRPTTSEVPSAALQASPPDLHPQCCAHIFSIAGGIVRMVFIDHIGARIANRYTESFANVPYTLLVRASEGQVAKVLADSLSAIDINFFVSSGSSVDETLGLNISHALAPFAFDFTGDSVLAGVMGWRDKNSLVIASQVVKDQLEDSLVDEDSLQRIFSLADVNKDNLLTKDELLSILQLPLTQIASSMDPGIIAEIENVLQSLQSSSTFDQVVLASLRVLDKNADGLININEFTRFVVNFVDRAHSMRSPGNIDEDGTRVVDMHVQIDGKNAVSDYISTRESRPFALLFMNVERGQRSFYQAGDYPAVIEYSPPKQSICNMEVSFMNERIGREYAFFDLDNQVVFEVTHGPRSIASENVRAPDGTYTRIQALSNGDYGLLRAAALNEQSPTSGAASSACSDSEDSEYYTSP